jgi:hypothetical protein
MTPPSAKPEAQAHQALWFTTGSGASALGIATGSIAAAVAVGNAKSLAHFWASGAMLVAYGFIALAVICFVLGVAGCPFPLGDGIKRQRRANDDGQFVTLPANRRTLRRRPHRRILDDIPEGLGRGLGALIPPLPPPERSGPLDLALEGEDWDMWQGCAWIAALKVRVTNTTSDRVIRLECFDLESDPGPGVRPKLTQDQVNALFHELVKRRDAYGASHLRRTELQPGDSISGWLVREAYLPFPARAGRPRCVLRVTDGVGDIYELEVPARAPQVRRLAPGI